MTDQKVLGANINVCLEMVDRAGNFERSPPYHLESLINFSAVRFRQVGD